MIALLGLASLVGFFVGVFMLFKNACKRKSAKKSFIFMVISIVVFIICVEMTPDSEPESESNLASEETGSQVVNDVAADETEADVEETKEISVGSDKNHPFVLTATELADEIDADISAAKEKYNGKWVQITGEITDTSDGGVSYGYYLYGESILTGYRGLRIMCWCDDGPFLQVSTGDTETFVGQVLEITTVNATEIISCERIK